MTALESALSGEGFIKLAMGNYKGAETDLKKIQVRKILVKREEKLSLTYQYKTRDIVKNYAANEAIKIVTEYLNDFQAATLTTTAFQLTLDGNNLKKLDVVSEEASLSHDKNKKRLIGPDNYYLHDLKITDANGEVYKNAQDKYRQINRYIEILEPLLKDFKPGKTIYVADMGSGKGYLTFALYDYMKNTLKLDAEVTGVEYRSDMVDLCNKIAKKAGFEKLVFVKSDISSFNPEHLDILIALHACDTATDDALYKGIKAKADLIVVAPCCHKQIRKEMEAVAENSELDFLLAHGIFMERQAEMVTDGIRAQLLQYNGYSTKVFEFISAEHTAKNVMITAVRNSKLKDANEKILKSVQKAKTFFGIKEHYLEKLLNQ